MRIIAYIQKGVVTQTEKEKQAERTIFALRLTFSFLGFCHSPVDIKSM